MLRSEYHISKMDCPSEENMIRMKLDGLDSIIKLEFDLANRRLVIFHSKEENNIESRLAELNLGSHLSGSYEVNEISVVPDTEMMQSKLLWTVLFINFGFFVIEMSTGLLSHSMGLVADSLDMLADAFVYGLSLWAVGSAITRKKKVALLSGYFQLILALAGMFEVARRFIAFEALPDYKVMILVSFLALIANAICLYLLQRSKSEEAHMKASMIFTSNDIFINAGVILAGMLVLFTQSKYPDLIVGGIVFFLVVNGALRILKLGR